MARQLSQHYLTVKQLLKIKNPSLASILDKGELSDELVYVDNEWDEEIDILRIVLRLPVEVFFQLKSNIGDFNLAKKEIVEAFGDCIGTNDSVKVTSAEILAASVNIYKPSFESEELCHFAENLFGEVCRKLFCRSRGH